MGEDLYLRLDGTQKTGYEYGDLDSAMKSWFNRSWMYCFTAVYSGLRTGVYLRMTHTLPLALFQPQYAFRGPCH